MDVATVTQTRLDSFENDRTIRRISFMFISIERLVDHACFILDVL